MDIDARISRRRRRENGPRLIRDYESLSPVSHVTEPSGRGPVLEQLLDHLDPAFDGRLPPNGYVYGPFGSGKSAIVTALFDHLDQLSTEARSVIHTSTRAATPTAPEFVYVDTRTAASEFAFYHAVLDELVEDPVPEHGVGTEELRCRIDDFLADARTGVVVAVDHVGEPNSADPTDLTSVFAGLPSTVSWLAIGRETPGSMPLTEFTADAIAVGEYGRETLVDLLMTRASEGLSGQALAYERARQIAEWAEGNAHDALSALLIAADRAMTADRTQIESGDVTAAIEEIPESSVSLARVLALPENKQLVLDELVDLDPADRVSVSRTTETISARPTVDLSAGTVRRFLYEMAEIGVVERVQVEANDGKGRPPSRVELRFPPTAFRRLSALRE
jgi:Cdc6-like AAA superfamily ATPase